MNIGELLSYKPQSLPKRPHPQNDDTEFESEYDKLRKQRRQKPPTHERIHDDRTITNDEDADGGETGITEEERRRILEMVEREAAQVGPLDDTGLKKIILAFEKAALKNQEMRIKFSDLPERFMESELELHEAIQEMNSATASPDLYPLIVELKAVSSIISLLSHENTDISIAVISLLHELTDVTTLNENERGGAVLVDALMENQICVLLIQNMERLDESLKEEAEGIHNTLGVIENLTEFRPEICLVAAQQGGLMQWLLKKKLRSKVPFDDNKLYASEILAILLQDHEENRQLLGEMDGVDSLLQHLAFYKRHDPATAEEREMMENLFNCLCSALLFPPNREKFLKGEGLQLMNLMLREKKLSRNGALKVLDHAMTGPYGADNSNKFVDILGLRTIFPLFIKTPSANKRKGIAAEDHEEHVISIIANMVRHCKGTQRQRLMSKFTENDFEKVDRLMELHFKYLDKVHEVDVKLDQDKLDDENEDQIYLQRLDGGLYVLQLVDYIILELCSSNNPSIKQRVMQSLNLRGASVKTIRNIMREYAGNLGDIDGSWKEEEEQHILNLVDKF